MAATRHQGQGDETDPLPMEYANQGKSEDAHMRHPRGRAALASAQALHLSELLAKLSDSTWAVWRPRLPIEGYLERIACQLCLVSGQ